MPSSSSKPPNGAYKRMAQQDGVRMGFGRKEKIVFAIMLLGLVAGCIYAIFDSHYEPPPPPTAAPTVLPEMDESPLDVVATNHAFATIDLDTRAVQTWGPAEFGGDSSTVSKALAAGVDKIVANSGAFVAVKDGKVVAAWGGAMAGGDASTVMGLLESDVQEVIPFGDSFAAVKKTGTVVWGPAAELDESGVEALIDTPVTKIVVSMSDAPENAGNVSYAALTARGGVVTWGVDECGGDSAAVADLIKDGVKNVFGSRWTCVFMAHKENGDVVTWGKDGPVNKNGVAQRKARKLALSRKAAMVLKEDGRVETWGDPLYAGNSSMAVIPEARRFLDIYPESHGFFLEDSSGGYFSVTSDYRKPTGDDEYMPSVYYAKDDPAMDDVRVDVRETDYVQEIPTRLLVAISGTNPKYRRTKGFFYQLPLRGGPVFFRASGDPDMTLSPFAAILARHDGESGGDVTILAYSSSDPTIPEGLRPYAKSGKTVALVSTLHAVTGINSDKTTFTFGGPYYGEDGTEPYLNGKPIA